MKRIDIASYTDGIDKIVQHSERFAPDTLRGVSEFRAELGGLVTILVASSYENIVKQVLIDYSSRHNSAFGRFTESSYDRLNSRIQIRDLHRYCKHGGPEIAKAFKDRLIRRKKAYQGIARIEMEKSYEQILSWRHDYAHAGIKNTSLEEAARKHRQGFPVLLSFAEAFEEFAP